MYIDHFFWFRCLLSSVKDWFCWKGLTTWFPYFNWNVMYLFASCTELNTISSFPGPTKDLTAARRDWCKCVVMYVKHNSVKRNSHLLGTLRRDDNNSDGNGKKLPWHLLNKFVMICSLSVCVMWLDYRGTNVVVVPLKFRKRKGN